MVVGSLNYFFELMTNKKGGRTLQYYDRQGNNCYCKAMAEIFKKAGIDITVQLQFDNLCYKFLKCPLKNGITFSVYIYLNI